jgi:branched-subunit amino acid permease
LGALTFPSFSTELSRMGHFLNPILLSALLILVKSELFCAISLYENIDHRKEIMKKEGAHEKYLNASIAIVKRMKFEIKIT